MRKIVSILSVVAVVLLWGCNTPRTDQASDRAAVKMAVLVHMVANADTRGESICFVDVQPAELEPLSDATGHRFPIALRDDAETTNEGIRSKRSKKKGVLIEVDVAKVHNGKAEAFGSYNQGTQSGFVGFRYRLHYSRGAWHIVSSECTVAS